MTDAGLTIEKIRGLGGFDALPALPDGLDAFTLDVCDGGTVRKLEGRDHYLEHLNDFVATLCEAADGALSGRDAWLRRLSGLCEELAATNAYDWVCRCEARRSR